MSRVPTPRGMVSSPLRAAALYTAAAVLLTWPLAAEMRTKIAADLGDPLFNCWVMMWTSSRVLAALHGHLGALSDYWNGNIFYPARLTIAFSEHLTPQMLQGLPVLAATGNVLLTYNLVLLATYVLSGLGMYLLVRDLTNAPVAAFVAGLAFAFAPYRIDQFSHLEVLSSQWMPFVIVGWRRFFITGRWRPLLWGTIALVAQAASCGYYLAYFTLFAVAYALYELVTRGAWRDRRTLGALAAAACLALVLMAPILHAYFAVRQSTPLGVRPLDEIHSYSADSYGFATASGRSLLWGSRLRARPTLEDQGFPGFAILLFAAIGVVASAIAARQVARAVPPRPPSWWRALFVGMCATALAALIAFAAALFVEGHVALPLGDTVIIYKHLSAIYRPMAAAALGLYLASPFCRRLIRGVPNALTGFFTAGALLCAWLSMGPHMFVDGRVIGPGLYWFLYAHVPGFDGLRVPSLFFMLVAFCLAVLVGIGAAALLRRFPRAGLAAAAIGAGAILLEGSMWAVPLDLSISGPASLHPAPQTMAIGRDLSPIYRTVQALPAGTVIAEFPFGSPNYDIQYTFYAGYHQKPILNGYSGYFPEAYLARAALWADVTRQPDAAWRALVESGATHAIVHENAFRDGWTAVGDWLTAHGAVQMQVDHGDRLFRLR